MAGGKHLAFGGFVEKGSLFVVEPVLCVYGNHLAWFDDFPQRTLK